jgi:type IV secretory pathway TraG/TraD family ATPase VirD4
MPTGEQLLFVKGTHAVRARKLNYLRDPEFRAGEKALFDENPMHLSGKWGSEGGSGAWRMKRVSSASPMSLADGEPEGAATEWEADGVGNDFALGLRDPGLPHGLRDV